MTKQERIEEQREKRLCHHRDKMAFYSSYFAEGEKGNAELRIYITNRAGLYGYQFAAIIWVASKKTGEYATGVSALTNGCGYNKEGAAAANAIRDFQSQGYTEEYRLADSGQIREALASITGGEVKYHAHG